MTPTILAARRTLIVQGRNSEFPRLSESKAAAVWLAKVLNGMKPRGSVS